MNRPRLIPLVRLLLGSLLLSLAVAQPASADIAAEVQAVTQDKVMRKATLGVSVVRLGTSPSEDKVVFEHGADKQYIPASNLKLVTTAAALETLGPAFKYKTALLRLGNGDAASGGDLVLAGDGDPEAVRVSVADMVNDVSQYVAGYRLKQEVQISPVDPEEPVDTLLPEGTPRPKWKVSVFLEVEGAAHYLPAYAGNLDIMTSAALRTGEQLASHHLATAEAAR